MIPYLYCISMKLLVVEDEPKLNKGLVPLQKIITFGAVPKLKILSLHVRVFWYNIGINSDITYEF